MPRVLIKGEKIHEYEVTAELTRGLMAICYTAKTKDGNKVFLKQYKSPTIRSLWYKNYISHLDELKKRVSSPPCNNFCYQFIASIEFNRCFYQVFEFLDSSYSLKEILESCRKNPKFISADQRLIMAKVFIFGIKALHESNIVHSDLKPDNVMLIKDTSIKTGYRLKIIDLDSSLLANKKAPWHDYQGYFGTPGYLSPEHLRREIPQKESDIFTVGLMLYELLGGIHPYVDLDTPYEQSCFEYKPKPISLVGTLSEMPNSELISSAIKKCLDPVMSKRPKAIDIHNALSASSHHPHFEKVSRKFDKLKLRNKFGLEKSFNITTLVNQRLARDFGDEYKHVGNPQYILEKQGGLWFIIPSAETVNETILNGKCILKKTEMQNGDVIAVGRSIKGIFKLPLTVNFE